jgi:hypothetical protein
VSFKIALLNDLMKNGLMPAATPVGRSGKAWRYRYDARAYRRGLQIARLRAAGVVERDALTVELFLRAYSLPPFLVRPALWAEFKWSIRSLIASVRSRYIQNSREIPAGHMAALQERLGPLDPTFEEAGLRLPPEVYVSSIRSALSEPLNLSMTSIDVDRLSAALSASDWWGQFAAMVLPYLSGSMMVGEAGLDVGSSQIDYVEKLLAACSNDELATAQTTFAEMLRFARATVRSGGLLGMPVSQEWRDAISKAVLAAGSPPWSSFLLVLFLMLERQIGPFGNPDEVQKAMNWISDKGISFPQILELLRGNSIEFSASE